MLFYKEKWELGFWDVLADPPPLGGGGVSYSGTQGTRALLGYEGGGVGRLVGKRLPAPGTTLSI